MNIKWIADTHVVIDAATVTDWLTLAWLKKVGYPMGNERYRVTAQQFCNRPGVTDNRKAHLVASLASMRAARKGEWRDTA